MHVLCPCHPVDGRGIKGVSLCSLVPLHLLSAGLQKCSDVFFGSFCVCVWVWVLHRLLGFIIWKALLSVSLSLSLSLSLFLCVCVCVAHAVRFYRLGSNWNPEEFRLVFWEDTICGGSRDSLITGLLGKVVLHQGIVRGWLHLVVVRKTTHASKWLSQQAIKTWNAFWKLLSCKTTLKCWKAEILVWQTGEGLIVTPAGGMSACLWQSLP